MYLPDGYTWAHHSPQYPPVIHAVKQRERTDFGISGKSLCGISHYYGTWETSFLHKNYCKRCLKSIEKYLYG